MLSERDHLALATQLGRLEAPDEVIEEILASLHGSDSGLLLYGSRARGDAVADSDWDFLALTDDVRGSVHTGLLSLSFYSTEQLGTGIGTLFGAHLARDGRVIWDKSGELARSLQDMGAVDARRLIGRVWAMSVVLGAPDRDLPRYLPGLLREARYLLRSCLYALAIERDEPCFSVRELARRYEEPDYVRLLASRQDSPPAEADFHRCVSLLTDLVGPLVTNQHGSLEALIVNEWLGGGDVIAMAMMAIGATGNDRDYIEVERILL